MSLKSSVVFCAVCVSAMASAQTSPAFDAWAGKPAPRFAMTDTNGKTWTNAGLKGKVVLLDFWATWCAPCKKASPAMQKLYQKFGRSGLVVLGAEAPGAGAPSGAMKYKAEHHYSYPFTVRNDGLVEKLGIPGIPAFVIIGKDGRIARTQTGLPPSGSVDELYSSFEKTIKSLLK